MGKLCRKILISLPKIALGHYLEKYFQEKIALKSLDLLRAVMISQRGSRLSKIVHLSYSKTS